jgi:PAS domain S-box-containing protein
MTSVSGSRIAAAEPLIQASLLGEAIDRGPVAVFVADENMRYIAVNAFAAHLLGYTREELLELKMTDVALDSGVAERFAEVVAHRRRSGSEKLTHKDGTEIELAYLSSETTIAGMAVYIAVMWQAAA